jgi:tetratricopeptide (TPR) repeat protein
MITPASLRRLRAPHTKRAAMTASKFLYLLPLLLLLLSGARLHAQADPYSHAESLAREKRWTESLDVLRPMLKRDPHNARALNLMGLVLIGEGNASQADAFFNRALSVNPRFVPALKNLAINEFDRGSAALAQKHLELAESLEPDDRTIHLYLGEIHFHRKDWAQATAEYGQIDKLASHNAVAGAHEVICYLHTRNIPPARSVLESIDVTRVDAPTAFELALILDQSDLPAEAIPFIDAVSAQHQDSYDVSVDRMLILIDAKEYARAITAGQEVSARGQDTAEIENLLGEAYAGNAQFQAAFEAYRNAINLDPKDEDNYLDLASLCLRQRSFKAARRVVDVALSEHPNSERMLFMRGLVDATEGNLEDAEKDFRLSESNSSKSGLGVIGLGASYLQNAEYDRAIVALRSNLASNPNDPASLYLLAEAHIRSGATVGQPAYAEAQSDLEKSVALDANLCLPHISLGKIYMDEKRYAEAAEQFEAAKRIDPTERAAYSHLAIAYRHLGDLQRSSDALAALKKMSDQDRIAELQQMKVAVHSTATLPGSTTP